MQEHLFERSAGLLLSDAMDRTVLVVGAGSVGSYAAELLTRSGIGRLIVVDSDDVEASNLSRSVYKSQDVGRPKLEALADRLKDINPSLQIVQHRCRFEDLGPRALGQLSDESAVVLAA